MIKRIIFILILVVISTPLYADDAPEARTPEVQTSEPLQRRSLPTYPEAKVMVLCNIISGETAAEACGTPPLGVRMDKEINHCNYIRLDGDDIGQSALEIQGGSPLLFQRSIAELKSEPGYIKQTKVDKYTVLIRRFGYRGREAYIIIDPLKGSYIRFYAPYGRGKDTVKKGEFCNQNELISIIKKFVEMAQ